MTVVLISNDNQEVTISERSAAGSNLIMSVLNDENNEMAPRISIPVADYCTLSKVVMFLITSNVNPIAPINKTIQPLIESAHLSEWYCNFLKNSHGDYDPAVLLGVLKVAWFMDCPDLIDVCCVKLACWTQDYSPEVVRKMMMMAPLTPEREYQLRLSNKWIFEIKNERESSTMLSLLEAPEES